MKKLVSRTIARLANEPLELYWLVGFAESQRMDWQVRTVFRGLQTGAFHLQPLPIGLLPILTPGVRFEYGEYRWDQARGEIGTATIPDVGRPEIITSAEIPPELYRFPSQGGVQRLFRYQTPQGEILIPVVELMRHLFTPNRKLAQSVMRPGALNLLYVPQTPGFQERCELRFTREMPLRLLSKRFAKEFGWIALDPEVRKAWDSIYPQTVDQAHVLFTPPSLRNSRWCFRGVRHGSTWLILELRSLTGRQAPFGELYYTHPSFRDVVKVYTQGPEDVGSKEPRRNGTETEVETIRQYEIVEGTGGSTAERNMRLMEAPIGTSEIDGCRLVKKEPSAFQESTSPGNPESSHSSDVYKTRNTKRIQVSADERDDTAEFPPIEFRGFRPAPPETMGDLAALDKTVRQMRNELPNMRFSQALVALKSGRALSVIGERPRPAMIVMIRPIVQINVPLILLDVERTGIMALSLMALRFRNPSIPLSLMEHAIQATLDGVVEAGGHWCRKAEKQISEHCESVRLPT